MFLVSVSENNKAQAAGFYHRIQQKKKDELNDELWKGTTKEKNQIACFDEKDLDRKEIPNTDNGWRSSSSTQRENTK